MRLPFSTDVVIESPLPVEQCTLRLEKITARYAGWIFSNTDERPIAGLIKNHSVRLCSRAHLGKVQICRNAYLSGQNTFNGSVWSGPLRPSIGSYVFLVLFVPIALCLAFVFLGEATGNLPPDSNPNAASPYFTMLAFLLLGILPPILLLRLKRSEADLLDCISQAMDGKLLKPTAQKMDSARFW